MTTESLQTIIAVENELLSLEQAEQARAAQWLKAQEASLREELRERRAELEAELEKARERVRADAERRAAEIVRAAEQKASRLAGISDDALRGILARHLVAMVTGRLP